MSRKLKEIQKKLAKLEKEADDLQQLRFDYECTKEFRRMIIKHKFD